MRYSCHHRVVAIISHASQVLDSLAKLKKATPTTSTPSPLVHHTHASSVGAKCAQPAFDSEHIPHLALAGRMVPYYAEARLHLLLSTTTDVINAQTYEGGSVCDLTGLPRETEVRYVCDREQGLLLQSQSEASTCKYVVIVVSSRLCDHPGTSNCDGLHNCIHRHIRMQRSRCTSPKTSASSAAQRMCTMLMMKYHCSWCLGSRRHPPSQAACTHSWRTKRPWKTSVSSGTSGCLWPSRRSKKSRSKACHRQLDV